MLAQTQIETEPGVNPDRPNVPYEGSKLNRKLEIVNLLDLEPEAQKILPTGGFGYISGGSGANWTRRENTEAFSRVQIEPQALSGVAKVDLTTEILGSKLSMPVFIPPMGSHGLAHVDKEAATAKGAAAVGTLMTTSTVSNLSLEEIASHNPGPKWFQLYVPTDRGYTRELIQRAKAAGYTAIAPTVDNVWSYPREENIRSGFVTPATLGRATCLAAWTSATGAKMLDARKRDLDWDDLEWIKQESGLPVMPKGVQSAKAARDGGEGRARRASGSPTTAAAPSTACRRPSPCCRASRRRWTAAFRSCSTRACGVPITCSRRWRSAPPWSAWAGRSCTAWRSAARRACRACSSTCATT